MLEASLSPKLRKLPEMKPSQKGKSRDGESPDSFAGSLDSV